MKLSQLFEANERGQHGTGNTPDATQLQVSHDELISNLENRDDGEDLVYIDDVEVVDPNTNTEYDTSILVKIDRVDHQDAHKGSAWSVDSDQDYYGYTDIDSTVVAWIRSVDVDADTWEQVDGEVALTKAGETQVAEILQDRIEQRKQAADEDAASSRAGH